MSDIQKLENTINLNNALIEIRINAIVATFDEEQLKKYKTYLDSAKEDWKVKLSQILSKDKVEEALRVLDV